MVIPYMYTITSKDISFIYSCHKVPHTLTALITQCITLPSFVVPPQVAKISLCKSQSHRAGWENTFYEANLIECNGLNLNIAATCSMFFEFLPILGKHWRKQLEENYRHLVLKPTLRLHPLRTEVSILLQAVALYRYYRYQSVSPQYPYCWHAFSTILICSKVVDAYKKYLQYRYCTT